MTLQQFKEKYLGKKVDFDGYYGGQCVDLYRQYVKEVLGFPQSPGVGGAAEIWDSASPEYYDFIPNSPTGVPTAGDIVIWNRRAGGGFGHVAIFLRGDVNSFVSLDQNWPTLDKVTETVHNYTNVIGWLHPKEIMANELETCLKDRQKFWDERDDLLRAIGAASVEEGKSMVGGFKSRITDLSNQLGTAQAEVKNKEEQVVRLKAEIANLENQLKERTDQVNQFARDKGELAVQVEQLKVQVETLKQQAANGEVTLTIKELFSLIWNQKITIKK